ncbi:hypothetical protein SCOCK_120158 [Actinacidiphila cocklensis]|uniref:Uncharacterized protein n=1 Tax=Actinacidiphila cocklensis TaxID=887465 RepID=A0A9W4DJV8_9ACTN|nr:hypothetical protein SCOCK_120158 [Actinacidiphila cocklensis]
MPLHNAPEAHHCLRGVRMWRRGRISVVIRLVQPMTGRQASSTKQVRSGPRARARGAGGAPGRSPGGGRRLRI